jgi:uncharacterized protein (DUF885 family)
MKRTLLFGLSLFLLSPVPAYSADPSEDARLEAFFKRFLDEDFRRRPLEATRLGDHRFDDRLGDLSARARGAWREFTRQTLDELSAAIDLKKMTGSARIDFEILASHLKRNLWLADNTHPFEDDPRIYNDYISESIYLLLTQSTLPRAANLRNCAARMAHIPRIVSAARANLRHPPRVFVETALKQNRGAIAFYEHGIFELAGETPQLSSLREPAQKTAACLRDYHKFLENLLEQARGQWRLGPEKFAQKLALELDAGVTAAEVLRDAQAEADRVVHEMYVIARQLWSGLFPRRPLPPDDKDGRRTTIRLVLEQVTREHGRAESLVDDARAAAKKIKRFIRDNDILRLPEPDRCRIIEMPEFQRGNALAYLNPAPPLDARASSYYAISPPPRDWSRERVTSFLQEYNKYMVPILTIHEAYPGHYVQLEYANRHRSLIRKVLYSGVFAEGWAVYTEQMMLDQGFGDGDLKLRLNQLKWYLRAVVNAILDHKMHCTNMSDQEALELLVLLAFQSEAEAILKIIRAKQSSCQLSTYFVGRMAFVRLRRQMQRELGAAFDLGRFHEAVLAHGTLPVKYLPALVRARLRQPR